jgi:hypothetical protein
MLSDSCSKFFDEIADAALTLSDDAHYYSSPPFDYGEEIDALRRSCMQVANDPFDPEAVAHLLRLARSIMRYHDTPPGSLDKEARRAEMLAIARAA